MVLLHLSKSTPISSSTNIHPSSVLLNIHIPFYSLSIHPSIHVFIYLSIYPRIPPSIHSSYHAIISALPISIHSTHPSRHLFNHASISYLPISIHPTIHPTFYLLSIDLSIQHPSIYSFHPFIHPFTPYTHIHPFIIYPCMRLSLLLPIFVHPSIYCLSIHPSIYPLHPYPSICPSITYLSIYSPPSTYIYPSIPSSIHQSIHLSPLSSIIHFPFQVFALLSTNISFISGGCVGVGGNVALPSCVNC